MAAFNLLPEMRVIGEHGALLRADAPMTATAVAALPYGAIVVVKQVATLDDGTQRLLVEPRWPQSGGEDEVRGWASRKLLEPVDAGDDGASATETGATETGAAETGATETGANVTGTTETGATVAGATEAGATEAGAAEPETALLLAAFNTQLAQIPEERRTPLAELTAAKLRELSDASAADALFEPSADAAPVLTAQAEVAFDGAAYQKGAGSDLKLLLFHPAAGGGEEGGARSGPLPCVLFLHGGCFAWGSTAGCAPLCAELAARSGTIVAALEYRLAPEVQLLFA